MTQKHNEIPTIWTAGDIAEYLRIERKTVLNNTRYQIGFPKPLQGSKRPLLWDRDAVIKYLYGNQR